MKLSKRQRKTLRELVKVAYERELKEHLRELSAGFDRWKSGEMSSGELSHLIHEFDRGPSRRMASYYNNLDPEIIVAQAIGLGRLELGEVPEELRERTRRGAAILKDL